MCYASHCSMSNALFILLTSINMHTNVGNGKRKLNKFCCILNLQFDDLYVMNV